MTLKSKKFTGLSVAAGISALAAVPATADQQILDDLIVVGSICVGQDCNNGESFGFDTLRLKENNLRIKFQDTSNSASFPTRDWQLTANDSTNGGANKFSIDDIDGGRTPFTIEAGAPSHSLYVDDGGRIGFGTSTPVVELHLTDGDTPTLRLEQDGTSGFTPQTWDVAGNESGFFVRDATNGSRLSFRIEPSAPASSIHIEPNGDVGVGTASAANSLHVFRGDGSASVLIQEQNGSVGNRDMLIIENNGRGRLIFRNDRTDNTALAGEWAVSAGDTFVIQERIGGANTNVLELNESGNLSIAGTISSGGTTLTVPDYVFAPDYELMPLAEVEEFIVANRHLPKIPSAAEINAGELNMTEMQMSLLEKVEELTLYTLAQQKTIDELQAKIDSLVD